MHMDFPESFRLMNELCYREEGFEDVKAVVMDADESYEDNPVVGDLTSKGYRIIDENYFGEGFERLGKVVVFVKGKRDSRH